MSTPRNRFSRSADGNVAARRAIQSGAPWLVEYSALMIARRHCRCSLDGRTTLTPASVASEAGEASPVTAASIGYWVLLLFALLALAETLYANHALAVRREVPR